MIEQKSQFLHKKIMDVDEQRVLLFVVFLASAPCFLNYAGF